MSTSTPARPRVVILGGGFGGLSAARALRRANVEITLVDRTNHHLFQPLLYQVATAVLPETDITTPIRWLLRDQPNARVLLGEVRDVDVERRVVVIDDEQRELPYDWLIVATGVRQTYYGHDDWERHAPGLKNVEDALEIRRRFLLAYEEAEKEPDAERRRALLTFVVIGGGATGVELAGSLAGAAQKALRQDFRAIDTRRTRIVLLEGGERILRDYPERLSARAQRDLAELGVEVRTEALVSRVEPQAVWIGGERIPTHTILWAAGTVGSPVARALGAPLNGGGRVQVSPDLSLPGHPEVFVVGDLASVMHHGRPIPEVAPAANQEGRHAGRNIARALRGRPRLPFRYFDKGMLATIGRFRAVGAFRERLHFTGRLAWWMWLFIHILYLAGFRNRVSVLVEWGYAFLTSGRGSRLLTATDAGHPASEEPVPVGRAADRPLVGAGR